MTHIEELIQLESIFGKIQAYLNFATSQQVSIVEKLPVRQRKVKVVQEENEEDDNEEEEKE